MAKNTEAKRTYKLDIMTVLEAADKGVKNFYTNLTEEEQKAFAPRVLMRWMSAVSDKSAHSQYAILATNDLLNLGLWSLNKHPELAWLLMCVCGSGKKQYHTWIPLAKKETTTPKLDRLIQEWRPHLNQMERDMLKRMMSAVEWQQLAQDMAYSDRELKDLKDELKKCAQIRSD